MGGVGKTVTSINLAEKMSVKGDKVLLIDLDPSGESSMLTNARSATYVLSDPLFVASQQATPFILRSITTNYDLIPSSYLWDIGQENAIAEIKFNETLNRLTQEYEYILIDCPSNFGQLTVNAISTAHEVVMPVLCDFITIPAIRQSLDFIRRKPGTDSRVSEKMRFLLTMFDEFNPVHQEISQLLRMEYGDKVFKSAIPLLNRDRFLGKELLFEASSTGGKAYMAITAELLGK